MFWGCFGFDIQYGDQRARVSWGLWGLSGAFHQHVGFAQLGVQLGAVQGEFTSRPLALERKASTTDAGVVRYRGKVRGSVVLIVLLLNPYALKALKSLKS